MKAVTVKYPWSILICSGIKDIENRTWNTNYKGRIFIHEGKNIDSLLSLTREQLNDLKERPYAKELIKNKKIGTSAIIGSVDINDCVIGDKNNSKWAEYRFDTNDKLIYNWILSNPILYENPIPMKGALSLWATGLHERVTKNNLVELVDIKSKAVVHTTKILKYHV